MLVAIIFIVDSNPLNKEFGCWNNWLVCGLTRCLGSFIAYFQAAHEKPLHKDTPDILTSLKQFLPCATFPSPTYPVPCLPSPFAGRPMGLTMSVEQQGTWLGFRIPIPSDTAWLLSLTRRNTIPPFLPCPALPCHTDTNPTRSSQHKRNGLAKPVQIRNEGDSHGWCSFPCNRSPRSWAK